MNGEDCKVTAGQEMNLRGKLGQQIDFVFEVLSEIDKTAKRIAEKTYGYGEPPSSEKESAKDCNSGLLNVFHSRLKDAESKARITLLILQETDSQL